MDSLSRKPIVALRSGCVLLARMFQATPSLKSARKLWISNDFIMGKDISTNLPTLVSS